MVYKLPLAPPETLGRRFQYALLSLRPDLSTIDPTGGYAIFQDQSDYLELLEEALDSMRKLQVGRPKGGCENLMGVDCCMLHRGPSLYAAGKRGVVGGQKATGDYYIMLAAGLGKCLYTTGRGKKTVAWTHAAVSYVYEATSRGSPLGGGIIDLPWLAKATLFGKTRVSGGGSKGGPRSVVRPTVDTLGSILLGGSISFLWGQRLGDSTIEFYLVPEAVSEGYSTLRDLMLKQGITGGSIARASRLASDYPVSLEVALALTLASDLARRFGPAKKLASLRQVEELERTATIVTLTPQQRPMVRSAIPLSTLVYASYSDRSIYSMLDAARYATTPGVSRNLQGIREVIGGCINHMLLQALHRRYSDHLSMCIRNLVTAMEQASNKGLSEFSQLLSRLARSLASDYMELAREEHV